MEKYNLKPSLYIDKNKLKNSILNTIPYSVFVLNKRKDIVFINNYNSTLKHLYNIEIEEGSNFSLLLNVEDTFLKEQFIKLNSCLDNVLEKQINTDCYLHLKNFYIKATLSPMDNDYCLILINKISELRNLISEKYEKQESYNDIMYILKATFEKLPLSFFIKNISDNFRYIYANKTFCDNIGMERNDIIGKTDYDIFTEEEAGKYRSDDLNIIINKKFKILDERTIWKNETRYWVTTKSIISNSCDDYIIGIAHDVTELRKNEKEAEYSNLLKKLSFNFAKSLTWEWDFETDMVITMSINDSKYYMEYPHQVYFDRIVDPTEREEYMRLCDKVKDGTLNEFEKTLKVYYGDRTHEWIHISGKRIIDPRTDNYKCIGICTNISREINMQEELDIAKINASRSEILKNTFISNLNHEIRTPLNILLGFSQIIHTVDDEEERETYLKIINSNGEQLLNMINDMLELSKLESGCIELHNEGFDLSALFDEIRDTFGDEINENISFTHNIPYKEFTVNLDRQRIKQLLYNFLSNAVKNTPSGYIEFGYRVIVDGIIIFVRDSGEGISKKDQHKIFDRFEKIDSFKPGIGLGMTINKGIIDSYGGSIELISEIGKGTEFRAFIPIGI